MSSPAPKRRQRLDPDERAARLLDAAIHVFAERGLARGGHAEVAEREGVATSTTFVYFPNRDALVNAAIEEVARFYVEMAKRVHARPRPARELVRRHADAFAKSVRTHPHYARLWLDWSTALRGDLWPKHESLQESIVVILSETLRRGMGEGSVVADLDVRSASLHIYASARMIVQLVVLDTPEPEVRSYLQTLLRLLFHQAD